MAPIEVEALIHWRRFLPEVCRELEAEGPHALPAAIRSAWSTMECAIREMQTSHPHLHRIQIEEHFRELLFPPPMR
jgi:hypothetical protein